LRYNKWHLSSQPAKAVTSNEKRETEAYRAITDGSQYYPVPCSRTTMDSDTYPI